jgi:hypothetical protein
MTGLALLAPSRGEVDLVPSTRADILARYRRLRTAIRAHHSACMDLTSMETLLQHGRKLGLARGRTFVCEDEDELTFVFDLALHTAPPDKTRLIDRYARTAKVEPGSDEGLALEAMRRARFVVVAVERHHPIAGIVVTDMAAEEELWLVDEALETSAPHDLVLAMRLYPVGEFWITAGVITPVVAEHVVEAVAAIPWSRRGTLQEAMQDRRFAAALYRAAIADGSSACVGYREVGAPET